MNENKDHSKLTIDANDLATYVVCPESWKLKLTKESKKTNYKSSKEAAASRQQWISTHSDIAKIKLYAKVAYVLLVMLVIVVFMMEIASKRMV